MDGMCELVCLNDIERLYRVKQALAARGVDAEVRGSWLESGNSAGESGGLRLMVRPQDLVYARWIAYAAGLDVWPEESSDDEGGKTQARPSRGRAA
jgi:hypothetical protein